MSTPLRLIRSPRNVVQAQNLTPTNRLLRFSCGEPWTPDSLRPLTSNLVTPRDNVSPQSFSKFEQPEASGLGKQCTASRLKGKGARKLPWSDGGKYAHKFSICKQEILAEPLGSFINQEKLSSTIFQYPSVSTPDRTALLKNFQSGKKVHNILGKGTFGTVFGALYHGKLVAGKISSPHPKALQQFMNESHAIGLQHPNIASVIKVVMPTHELNGFLIMEHVMGYSLQHLIDLGSHLGNVAKRAKYSLHIAKALEYCHSRGILHLDVKPKNILVHHFSDTCKLCDFGCSSLIGTDSLSLQGTVQYVAPEVLQGEPPTTAADVYSLGITMWQLASGEYPYEGEGNHSIIYKVVAKGYRPTLPTIQSINDSRFISIVQMCWNQLPQSRAEIEKIIHQLDALLKGI